MPKPDLTVAELRNPEVSRWASPPVRCSAQVSFASIPAAAKNAVFWPALKGARFDARFYSQ